MSESESNPIIVSELVQVQESKIESKSKEKSKGKTKKGAEQVPALSKFTLRLLLSILIILF